MFSDKIKVVKSRIKFAKNLVNAEFFKRTGDTNTVEYSRVLENPSCDSKIKIYAQFDPTTETQAVLLGAEEYVEDSK